MHGYSFKISAVYITFFIPLLAPERVDAFLISAGAMFQSLAESMLILWLAALDLEESFHMFVVLGLNVMSCSLNVFYTIGLKIKDIKTKLTIFSNQNVTFLVLITFEGFIMV